MGEKAIEYLFVHDGRQWWLKLTEADQIADYHKKTAGSRYEGAINLYRKLRQEGREWHNLLDGMELQERIIEGTIFGNRNGAAGQYKAVWRSVHKSGWRSYARN